jgi:hypothetical protein
MSKDTTPDAAMVEVTNALGCFDAAECEGLQEALLDTQDERLKDLVLRRLLYAPDHLRAALEALTTRSQLGEDAVERAEAVLARYWNGLGYQRTHIVREMLEVAALTTRSQPGEDK